MPCMCEWPDDCDGYGSMQCEGCGGDQCVCICGGEYSCFGCSACEEDCNEFDEDGEPA